MRKGQKHSAETRERISSKTKEIMTPEHRERLSVAQKGKKLSTEHRDKISSAVKDSWTPERRKNRSVAYLGSNHPRFGKNHSKKSIARMSAAKKGKKHSAVSRSKMSESHKGIKHTEETKRKMSIASKQRITESDTICLNYNKTACRIFDVINKRLNVNGLHALNGGEKVVDGRYAVDYYCEDLKLIIEWDEPHHFTEKQRINDEFRHKQILMSLPKDWMILRWNEKADDWREEKEFAQCHTDMLPF